MTTAAKPHGRVAATLVGLVAALAFLPSLAGGFVWDDEALIRGNARIRNPESLVELVSTPFWAISSDLGDVAWVYQQLHRPLVKLAYHLELRAFGDEPFGFHVVSLLLHVACALLVFDAARARIPDENGSSNLAAAAAAALFAVHPTRVESVAWISGSTDLFMTFFVLVAEKVFRDTRVPFRYVAGAVALALAGFSKEPALLVPLLIALDAFQRGEPRNVVRRSFLAGVAASAAVGAAWFLVARSSAAVGSSTDAPMGSLVPRVLASFGGYVELLIHPGPGTVFPARFVRAADGQPIFSTVAIAVGAVATLGLAALVASSVRHVRSRPWAADLAWFVVPLLPVLNVLPRNADTLVTDRCLYLPLVGIAFAFARGTERAFRASGALRAGAFAVLAALVTFWARFDVADTARFHDGVALFANEVRVHPEVPELYESLAAVLTQAGHVEEAVRVSSRGVDKAAASGDRAMQARMILVWSQAMTARVPDSDQATLLMIRRIFDGFVSTGTLAGVRDGRPFELHVPAAARRVLAADPELVAMPRATIHVRTFDIDGGITLLREVVAERPRAAPAYQMLTVALARQGRFDEALAASDTAERVFPGAPAFRAMRASVEAARRLASRPVTTPREAAMRDAEVQLVLGAPEHARRILDPVLAQAPVDHELVFLRSKIDVGDGRFDLAAQTIERARAAAPDDPFFPMLAERLAAEEQRRARSDAAGGRR